MASSANSAEPMDSSPDAGDGGDNEQAARGAGAAGAAGEAPMEQGGGEESFDENDPDAVAAAAAAQDARVAAALASLAPAKSFASSSSEEDFDLVEQHIRKAEELRAAGTAHAKAGDWKLALNQWCKIKLWINGHTTHASSLVPASAGHAAVTESQSARVEALKMSADLNCTLANLKLGNLKMARRYIDKALEMNPNHPKAALRKAQVALRENDLSSAEEYLGKADKAFPGDPGVAALQATFAKKMEAFDRRERKRLGGMFDKIRLVED